MTEQWDLILNFLAYLGVTLPLMAVGVLAFIFTTPYNEFRILRLGSGGDPKQCAAAKAVAHDLGGKITGLAIVLASAIYHSVSMTDLILWGILGILFQIIVFYVFELITPFRVVKEIPEGNVAVGLFASRLNLAAGLLMAALISY